MTLRSKVIRGIFDGIESTVILAKRLHRLVLPQKKRGFTYLTVEEIIVFNEKVTSTHGLLRDRDGLESALMRPQTAYYYEKADIVRQAALLVDGISMAHSFIDGNKRTALLACATFLDINGFKLEVAQQELAKEIEALVITRDTERFIHWLRGRIQNL